MKLFVIIFSALIFISCEDEPVEPIDKERGICVYKVMPKCVSSKPWECPPKYEYLTCIYASQSYQYSNVDLYKIDADNCGCTP